MTAVPTTALRPGYEVSRVIRGGLQLAGGDGPVNRAQTIADMTAFADAGIFTIDCADIYTGVESLVGEFRAHYLQKRGAEALGRLKIQTKLVPDLDDLTTLGRQHIRQIIDRSLARLRMDRLDLVQFHWWDYNVPRYLDVLCWLDELRVEGKIAHIGAVNFDTPHLIEIIASGIPLLSIQVQYSLIDRRPERALVRAAQDYGIQLFAFGTVAGGFLADDWLGQPEPAWPPGNRSLAKYKLIIDDFGGWALFQMLLRTLRSVADRHQTDIATIASAAIFDRPIVAAVIVGAQDSSYLAQNVRIATLALTEADKAQINAVLAKGKIPEGDTYTLERDRNGRHGQIINPNLHRAS